jgi:hypothetical protein
LPFSRHHVYPQIGKRRCSAQARVAYIRHLRRERRQPAPQHAAASELAAARSEWLRLRSSERKQELVPMALHQETIDTLAGLTLTALTTIPSRLHPYASDLAERKRCEGVIRQVRQELAAKALRRAAHLRDEIDKEKLADERGELPLDTSGN